MKATKEELQRQSAAHQSAIESDFTELKRKAGNIGKVAAVVGTGFFVSYLIVRAIRGEKEYVTSDEDNGKVYAANANVTQNKGSSFLRTISGIVMTEAAVFLVGIAKEQLAKIINKPFHHDEETA